MSNIILEIPGVTVGTFCGPARAYGGSRKMIQLTLDQDYIQLSPEDASRVGLALLNASGAITDFADRTRPIRADSVGKP